jgi:hypothetical protein
MNIVTRVSITLAACGLTSCGVPKSSAPATPTFQVHGKVTVGLKQAAALGGAYVQRGFPAGSSWSRIGNEPGNGVANIATTAADGSFTYKIPLSMYSQDPDRPYYVMASDPGQTLTMVAILPFDLIAEDADIAIDINPATTVVGLWHCPNGVFSAPTFACPEGSSCQYPGGAPCYLDAEDSRDTRTIQTAVDTYIASGAPSEPMAGDWPAVSGTLLASPQVLAALNGVLTAGGFWNVTSSAVSSQIGNVDLPIIPKPTWVDLNDGSCGAAGHYCASGEVCLSGSCAAVSGGGGGGGACCANWSCGTSTQCASVMGGKSGSQCQGLPDINSCKAWCNQYIPGNCNCTCG